MHMFVKGIHMNECDCACICLYSCVHECGVCVYVCVCVHVCWASLIKFVTQQLKDVCNVTGQWKNTLLLA